MLRPAIECGDVELRILPEPLRHLPVPVPGRPSRGRPLLACPFLETEANFLALWAVLPGSLT